MLDAVALAAAVAQAEDSVSMSGAGADTASSATAAAAASILKASYGDHCRPKALHWVRVNYLVSQVILSPTMFFQSFRWVLGWVLCLLGFVLGSRLVKSYFELITSAKVSMKKHSKADVGDEDEEGKEKQKVA